jgi:hypothetical protein
MKQPQIIAILILSLFLCQTSCQRSGQHPGRRLPSAALNPYRGAVKELVQKQVGDYRLISISNFQEMAEEVKKASDAVGAIYNSSTNQPLQHMVTSFASPAEANKELDEALKRYKDAHVSFRLEDVRDGDGKISGRKIIVNDLNTEAMNWTNGSLYCTAVSYTGNSSAFSKDLPY